MTSISMTSSINLNPQLWNLPNAPTLPSAFQSAALPKVRKRIDVAASLNKSKRAFFDRLKTLGKCDQLSFAFSNPSLLDKDGYVTLNNGDKLGLAELVSNVKSSRVLKQNGRVKFEVNWLNPSNRKIKISSFSQLAQQTGISINIRGSDLFGRLGEYDFQPNGETFFQPDDKNAKRYQVIIIPIK